MNGGRAMKTTLTNQDTIVGFPTLLIRQMFIEADEPIDVATVEVHLSIGDIEAGIVLDDLVVDGYLAQPVNKLLAGECFKTPKAVAVTEAGVPAPITWPDVPGVVLALMAEVAAINTSPTTAHRVRSVTFTGAVLQGVGDSIPFVEATVVIYPLAGDNWVLQGGLENLSVEHVEEHGHVFKNDRERAGWSVTTVHERLLGVNPQMCVRIVR